MPAAEAQNRWAAAPMMGNTRSFFLVGLGALAGVASACAKPTHDPLPPSLRGYVGCYVMRGIGRNTGEPGWHSLRLTDQPYRDPTGAFPDGYLAAVAPQFLYYYWYVAHDTLQVRPRRDLALLGTGVDSLKLWRNGREFSGYLSRSTDMLGFETSWDVVAARMWCQL